MKRKIIYLVVGVLTFILGVTVASLLVINQQTLVEVEIESPPIIDRVLIETKVSNQPINPVYQQKNSPGKPKHLAAIEIVRFDPEIEVGEIKVEDLSVKPIDFDLDLGNSIENQIIALHPYRNDSREFKIEQQFETSMSISDEGPHLDLTDWKHYTSDWQEIKRLEGNRFLTPKISESDYQRFPKVTSKEIYNAVLKWSGKRWANHARSCKTANDGACLVSVSRISFRIKAKENGRWNIIHNINVFVPMGC